MGIQLLIDTGSVKQYPGLAGKGVGVYKYTPYAKAHTVTYTYATTLTYKYM